MKIAYTVLPVFQGEGMFFILSGGLNIQPVSNITTTTTAVTTQINRIRGFSLVLLEELQNSGGLRTTELRDITGKKLPYVRRYLLNLKNYGCISKVDNWGWEITSLGLFIFSSYTNTNYDERKMKEERKKDERKMKENKQFTLAPWQSERTEFEVVVVDYLLDHYNKTGSKFIYQNQFDPETLEIPPGEVREIISKLLSDGIIYKYYDRQIKLLKIGLKDSFLERLQHI